MASCKFINVKKTHQNSSVIPIVYTYLKLDTAIHKRIFALKPIFLLIHVLKDSHQYQSKALPSWFRTCWSSRHKINYLNLDSGLMVNCC